MKGTPRSLHSTASSKLYALASSDLEPSLIAVSISSMAKSIIVPSNERQHDGSVDSDAAAKALGHPTGASTCRHFGVGLSTPPPDTSFAPNRISTSIYTPYNFLFKNLFKQFARLSNMYFLFITVLQVIPQVTLSGGYPTTIVPLVFVLFVNAIKDLIEDIHRHNADTVQNSSKTLQMQDGDAKPAFVATTWADLHVGSIVKVHQNEIIPADMIILASSSPIGQCFTMTANLDGETNLKIRWVPSQLASPDNPMTADADIWAKVGPEEPSRRLDRFKATLTTCDNVKVSIGISNLLLRGVLLRDTDWAVGVTVYTGDDTKIQQNSGETPFKSSSLSKMTNIMTYQIIVLQVVLQIVAVVVEALGPDLPYSPRNSQSMLNAFWLFLTYMLLFSNFVPISLQVTVDITRFVQSILLCLDTEMALGGVGVTVYPYCPSYIYTHYFYSTKYYISLNLSLSWCQVRCSDLNEDLGVIQHIFTDKTGTLTCNNMEFRKCAIDGVSFGNVAAPPSAPRGSYLPPSTSNNYRLRSILPFPKRTMDMVSPRGHLTHVNIVDKALQQKVVDERHPRFVQFFVNLAVNSAVVPIVDAATGRLVYSAISPDEEALVCAAKHFDVTLLRHDSTSVAVSRFGDTVLFDVLHMFEFSSERKKSSMIVRERGGSAGVILFCKGADTVVFPALRSPVDAEEDERYTAMKQHLVTYAAEGLRVLCVAQRELSDDVYEAWNAKYLAAKTASDTTEDDLDAIVRDIETQLDLVGITGIEDRLQDGVADALQCFRLAGIKVWMLTGDRPDTAVNIGHATQLISNDMQVVQISTKGTAFIAHVGVGIMGAEGQQAANASDYSIPEFQSLKRLLLVHGRWMNRRMSILTLYMFYKNVLLVLPQFFFGYYCSFSGQSTYYDSLYQLYNVCFTALPVFLFSVSDQHVSAPMSLQYPSLYASQSFGSIRWFWLWILDACISSLVILFIPLAVLGHGPSSIHGFDQGLWDVGLVMNGAVVVVANLRLALESKCWFWFIPVGFASSLGLWSASAYAFSSLLSFGGELYAVLGVVANLSILFMLVLVCVLCCFGAYGLQAYHTTFAPHPTDICHEIDVWGLDPTLPSSPVVIVSDGRVHPKQPHE
ncbi:hypothetical protein B5M09_002587 [Aphanomyces astaci]|uniref:P-type phospholipid transporter n=1 Tax=Aphanomyces astaci TaxID=112090 RepID=A0A425D9Y9_APHAT|nr:hypothetical protein B5M09_002587 [Aphanomyces astaci]